jgi:hypothetical protein
MAKPELIDTGGDKRYLRRDERGRFKEASIAGRSQGQPIAASLEGVPELVAATREQTAAIDRQTAVIERLLTFLSPAAAGRERQETARDMAGADPT